MDVTRHTKYYEVKSKNMVADSVGVYCTIDGEKQYFEATTTRDNPNIDLHSTDEEMLKEINLDLSKLKSILILMVENVQIKDYFE